MNKTININLDGRVFQIEEEAYDKLHSYLETIKKRLGNSEEAREILSDIEARIAELFLFKSAQGNIDLSLVEEIMDTIGEPSEIVDEDDSGEANGNTESESAFTPPYYGRKSLFRDKDDRIFGGVCSGLGAYFDIDPIVFRILAVVTTLLSVGAVPLIYIVLWIALPEARTLEQRIRMRGGFTFKGFGDNIKQEYDAMSGKFKTYTSSPNYRNMQRHMNRTGDAMSNGLHSLLKVLATILGIVLVLWSILSIMSLIGIFAFKDTLLGLIVSEGNHYITNIPDHFLSHFDQTLVSISALLILGVPLMVILYLGLKLVFQFRSHGKIFGMTALFLWLSGIVLLFFTGLRVAKSFEETNSLTESHQLQTPAGENILLEVSHQKTAHSMEYLFDTKELELYLQDGQLMVQGSPHISISKGDSFSISITRKARGMDEKDAEFNARATSYQWMQNDSILYLDKVFILDQEALVRQQKIYVDIQIPYNKNIQVSPYLDRLIEEY